MKAGDRLIKKAIATNEGYRFVELAKFSERHNDITGSYVRIDRYDDSDGQKGIWIPLIVSGSYKSFQNFGSVEDYKVAVFQLKEGGYQSAFGMLVPAGRLNIDEQMIADKSPDPTDKVGIEKIVSGG